MKDFQVGELVAFIGKAPDGAIYTVEVGKIKKLCQDGAFVYYHTGDTSAKTDYNDLYKIKNAYAINNLGGENSQINQFKVITGVQERIKMEYGNENE